jgi:hypothetical protein
MGLEPTTFCMARTKREPTRGDTNRQPAPLRGAAHGCPTRGDTKRQPNLTRNLTNPERRHRLRVRGRP